MAERIWIARVRADEKDPETLIVAAPGVGVVDGVPRQGLFLNPLDRVSTVKVLGVRHVLRLPRDIQGRVVETFIPNACTPVGYNAPLVRIDPRGAAAGAAGGAGAVGAAGAGSAGEQAGAGLIKVTATSEGIFYSRSAPDAPSFVEIGSPVAAGTVLGLIEVMKCFNQITYGGPGLPERGEIVRILAADAGEVQFGQELFWVRPVEG